MSVKHPLFYVDDVSELKLEKGFWYIATPYTKYRDGLEAAYHASLFADIQLGNLGIRTWCAIRECHPMSMATGIDNSDANLPLWLAVNRLFIDRAHGMVIVTFQGWEDSRGIAEEIKLFAAACKPIFLLDPKTLGWDGTIMDVAKAIAREDIFADEDHVTIPGYEKSIDFTGWPDHLPIPGEVIKNDNFSRTSVDNPKQAQGAKKTAFSAIPANVLGELACAMHEGARKYGRHNFRVAGEILASTYYDATLRHLMAWWEGQDHDPEGEYQSHLIKAMAGLTVLRDAISKGTFKDDRPAKADKHAYWLEACNSLTRAINAKYPEPKAPFVEKKAA